MKTPIKSTVKEDFKTGQYFPAIEYSDGSIVTYSPTSFDHMRALAIADDLLSDMLRRIVQVPSKTFSRSSQTNHQAMSEQTNTQNVCPFCGGPGYHVRGCGLRAERDKDREEWIDLMEENQSLRERLAESTEALEKAFEACKNGHRMQTECYGCQRDEARAELERERIAASKYATAARVIALHLERFCDESLPYDQMIADAARKAGAEISKLESQFQRANQWNTLCELELNNLRSLKDDLEGYLRAVLEHIAPMLKLYEPNLPEHPVIAAIRDYLDKP